MKRSPATLAAVAWLLGSLACAGGSANEDETAAAPAPQQDTAQVAEPPPGYSGMEQDTTGAEQRPTAVDTFLNEQGTGVPADTAGYGGLEHPDTTGAAGTGDTTGMTGADTSSPSTGVDTSGMSGMDTTGQQ
jgi:hypothetical protein